MTKPSTSHKPPRGLSLEARQLWRDVLTEHVVDDAVGLTLLGAMCQALDGLRNCQQRIEADGLMVPGSRGQLRPHPLLATAAEFHRSLLAASRALKLDVVTSQE